MSYARCYYCGEGCEAYAGNPGRWPVALCHPDEPGVTKWHHVECVSRRLELLARAAAAVREHLETLPRCHQCEAMATYYWPSVYYCDAHVPHEETIAGRPETLRPAAYDRPTWRALQALLAEIEGENR